MWKSWRGSRKLYFLDGFRIKSDGSMRNFFLFLQRHCPLADCEWPPEVHSIFVGCLSDSSCMQMLTLRHPRAAGSAQIFWLFHWGVSWHRALPSLITPTDFSPGEPCLCNQFAGTRSSVSVASWQLRWHRLLLTWLSLYRLVGTISWAPGVIHRSHLCQGRSSKGYLGLSLTLGHSSSPPLENVPQGGLKSLFQIRWWVRHAQGYPSKGESVIDGTHNGLLADPLVFYIIRQLIIFPFVW